MGDVFAKPSAECA